MDPNFILIACVNVLKEFLEAINAVFSQIRIRFVLTIWGRNSVK